MTREQRMDFYNRFYWAILIGIVVLLGLVSFTIYEYRMSKTPLSGEITQEGREKAKKALNELIKHP